MDGNAYVYECDDCELVIHGRDTNPYAGSRMYAGSTTTVKAWHVGVDTGAPWHEGRTSCDVADEVEAAREALRARSHREWQ